MKANRWVLRGFGPIRRVPGYLYFMQDGDLHRVRRGGGEPSLVRRLGLKNEPGFMYYLGMDGRIHKEPMENYRMNGPWDKTYRLAGKRRFEVEVLRGIKLPYDPGTLQYIGRTGDVTELKIRFGAPFGPVRIVRPLKLEREAGYLYYVGSEGLVKREPVARGQETEASHRLNEPEGSSARFGLNAIEPPLITEAGAKHVRRALRLLKLHRGDRILDLGCGRGRIAIEAARMGYRVTAVDDDEKALAVVSETAVREKLSVDCWWGDFGDYPPGKPFDAAVMAFAGVSPREALAMLRPHVHDAGRVIVYEQVERGFVIGFRWVGDVPPILSSRNWHDRICRIYERRHRRLEDERP